MTIIKAEQYLQCKDYSAAELTYKNLLRVNINNVEALWGLGKIALIKNSYQRAYDLFVRCLHINANIPGVFLSLAQACSALTLFDKSEQALLSAYQLNNNSVHALYALSVYYCESGQFDKSEQFLTQLLEIDKDNVPAFSLLVRMKKVTLDDSYKLLITQFESTFKTKNLSLNDSVLLNYSFADLYHSNKEHIRAYKYYEEANRLQRQSVEFSVSDMLPSIELLKRSFGTSFIQSFSDMSSNKAELAANINITPIFIVGQPRSGSTLLEQMLIGHKEIVSAGELPHLGDDIVDGITQMTEKGFPLGCQSLTQQQCLSLALHYLNNLKQISGGKHRFVIDKMPANFQFIGLIKLILPQAKIFHIKRNPRDVSWSIYRNNFQALEPHFCSQRDIGEYHHIYKALMDHWGTVLPDAAYDVEYEELVNSPKEELTNALAFCGLSFDDECLNFASKKRVIKTLSDTQLRQGIFKRKTPDWLPYENELKQIFDLLNKK